MAFSHNSRVKDNEPGWGSVDKQELPWKAFVWEAPGFDRDQVSTWSFPHHWVANGGAPDENGRFTTGELFLHKGGLNAAWAAAQGARSGEKAPQAVIDHLQKHRKALGLDEKTRFPPRGCRRVIACEAKDLVTESNVIEGIASTFGNFDFDGDRFFPGAFGKTIRETVGPKGIPFLTRHALYGGDVTETIGVTHVMEERSDGLYQRTEILDDTHSQAVLEKVRGMLAHEFSPRISIGFAPIPTKTMRNEQGGWDFHEVKLIETTLTLFPANPETRVTSAKALLDLASQLDIDVGALDPSRPIEDQAADAKRICEAVMRRLESIGQPDDIESNHWRENVKRRIAGIRRRASILELEL